MMTDADIPPPGWSMQSLGEYQKDIHEWHVHNFGDNDACPPTLVALALTEEVGELSRCAVKHYQGIRGTPDEWLAEMQKEIGDVFILLAEVASRYGINLGPAVWDRWNTIYRRDWRTNSVGHGMPS